MLKEIKNKKFANGVVYALQTDDGLPIEVTDTFLPFYTKDAIGRKQNALTSEDLGSRAERWMIGVSTMSGCPVKCKFCATSKLKKCRNLTYAEIVQQIVFVLEKNGKLNMELDEKGEMIVAPLSSQEFKINYTRMGEPFLNIENVRKAITLFDDMMRGTRVHHYLSTIGINGSDFSWIKDNITLQFSVHSFDDEYRDWLIPYPHKMSLEEIGQVRTQSNLKTTINLTMARPEDFDIELMKKWFDPEHFFVKVSPINENETSKANKMGAGIINQINLL